jgi:hypothetical protein
MALNTWKAATPSVALGATKYALSAPENDVIDTTIAAFMTN